MASLEVRKLRISARTAEKLREKHGLDPEAVREAIEGVGRLPFRWHHDPVRGSRALVVTAIGDRQACLVVLYPAPGMAADTWNLGSAYPLADDP